MTSERATFGAGCFWGVEHVFREVPGVLDVVVGYAGGITPNPSYREVCTGRTGHAEVAQVTFDPDVVTYDQLLQVFWAMHDPTQIDRQGPDHGSQYRSLILAHSPQQLAAAEASRSKAQPRFERPIATEVREAGAFYPAEAYHQEYYAKTGHTPYCHAIPPGLLEDLGLVSRAEA
jgi:peptide-methionine (S)-S-oxide reductase